HISHTTLYRYINDGLFLRITNKNLPLGKRKRQYNKVRRVAYKNALKPGIDTRPQEVKDRQTFGHWEMDTVIGKAKGKGACLLVLSERKTRAELIIKIRQKTATNVVAAINRLERLCAPHFKDIFKSITVDNGTEFDDTEGITKNNRTKLYYCHPYSSWERGTNENINKMIRRHIPKSTSLTKYTKQQIKEIQNWINNYPRQIFNGKTSNMLLDEEITKITGLNLSSFLATNT
ncbi:IS30 family transposase, partial [Ruminococcaceae bacterium OttesenSCG-928-D13]|nr:IS30 family transposase [Ruminococcaceae bacterium OttesenSCG-928-D13]